jgi:hypothetical protein
MTSKTGFFAAAQNDKLKPVILRVVPSPEGSGVVFRGKTKVRSFAAAQDDREPDPSLALRMTKQNQALTAFRTTKPN